MRRREAIRFLEAILEDTLDHNDELDAARIQAVELAIKVLRTKPKPLFSKRRRFYGATRERKDSST